MDLRNLPQMKETARRNLAGAPQARRITGIYVGILLLSSLVVTMLNFFTGQEIANTGGLSGMGMRSVLSSLQQMLPLVQSVALMGVEFGYVAAMLRISRNQYTSPKTMKLGIRRFGALLRSALVQAANYFLLSIASAFLAVQIYFFTPMSNRLLAVLEPYAAAASDPNAMLEGMSAAEQAALLESMVPLYLIMLVLFLLLVIPKYYGYRMVNYVLMDQPSCGALLAISQSKAMMRGNKWKLFQVDLSFWWYHGLCMLAAVLCYGDLILSLLGVPLPMSSDVSYFLFYGLFLAAQGLIYFFLRSQVEVTCAQVYDAIRPKPTEAEGVVLGNIFQM